MPVIAPVAAVAAVAVAGVGWGLVEARSFAVRRVQVPLLPAGHEPVRVLHLADIHATPRQRKKLDWLRSLGQLGADMVVNTGDNLAHIDAVPAVVEALQPLLRLPGAYVYGSNDYHAPRPKNPFGYFAGPSRARREPHALPTEALTEALDGAGWANLNNRRGHVGVRGLDISLVGLDDPHIGRDAMPKGGREGEVHLGVVHAPYAKALDALASDGADMIFAGHTHGGQVCVPGWGALVTNCDLPTRKAKGLHGWPGPRPGRPGGEHSTWLHVSAGVGTSPYAPVRFACRPEATLVELLPRGG